MKRLKIVLLSALLTVTVGAFAGWSGSGSFTRTHDWTDDAAAAIPITASRMDAEDDNFATGINACLAKNGENAATGNLNIGGYRLTSVGAGSAATDAATIGGAETLTNKTLTAPVLSGTVTGTYTLGGTPTLDLSSVTTSGDLPVASGGTGASTAADARTNLGLGTAAVEDATAFATAAQGTKADSMYGPLGQCQVTLDGTTIRLDPYKGNKLFINGAHYAVPSAGVTIAGTGLTADTNYYVYAWMDGSTMTLELSTTGHSTDTTYGHEYQTGVATRSLVGLVRTNSSGTVVNTASQRFVRSWFNDPGVAGYVDLASTASISSATMVTLSSAFSVGFLLWAGEVFDASADGLTYCASDGRTVNSALYLNGSRVSPKSYSYSGTDTHAKYIKHHSFHKAIAAADGYNYFDVYGHAIGGHATSFFGTATNDEAWQLRFSTGGN